jgi:hypothetical protein
MSGSTPKRAGSKSGAQSRPVRKSTTEISEKNSKAGTNSAITIPTVVATEISAQTARTPLTTSSPMRRRWARSRSSVPAVRSGADNYPSAASRSLFAFSTCSSVSGTYWAASATSVALSIMYRTKASTSGRCSDSVFA